MMLRWRELLLSLMGVWRLARFDPSGHQFFDRTQQGAARSFFAAVLMAPLYALTLIVAFRSGNSGEATETARAAADPLRYALAEGIAYAISWTAYPVAVEWLSHRLNCRDRFFSWLVAYNWTMVLQNSMVMLFSLLTLSRLLPDDLLRLLWVAVFGVTLAWLWFIARTALVVSPGTAVGLVMLDVLVSAAIDGTTANLY